MPLGPSSAVIFCHVCDMLMVACVGPIYKGKDG